MATGIVMMHSPSIFKNLSALYNICERHQKVAFEYYVLKSNILYMRQESPDFSQGLLTNSNNDNVVLTEPFTIWVKDFL